MTNRIKLSWIWLVPLMLFIGCGESLPPEDHPLRQLLQKQLAATYQSQGTYHKSIADLQNSTADAQIQTFDLSADSNSDNQNLLEDELYYAFVHVYSQAPDSSYLTVNEVKDTLIAVPTIAENAAAELKQQKIVLLNEGQTIKYIESKVERENWLYENYVHIKVDFDSLGLYHHHTLEVITRIKLVGQEIHGYIEGNIQDE